MFVEGMNHYSPRSSSVEAKIIKLRVSNYQVCPYLYINIIFHCDYWDVCKNIAGTYYSKTLLKSFCFNLKKNLLSKSQKAYCINYFWVTNELYCAIALSALNIADIKPKVLHDP